MEKNFIVPKNKDDSTAVEKLKSASAPSVIAVAKDLLEWIQDGNWPIAKEIAEILSAYTNSIKSELLDILKGQDDIWKYWCINGVIYPSKEEYLDLDLINELKRIVNAPTKGEKEEEVNLSAEEALDKWELNR